MNFLVVYLQCSFLLVLLQTSAFNLFPTRLASSFFHRERADFNLVKKIGLENNLPKQSQLRLLPAFNEHLIEQPPRDTDYLSDGLSDDLSDEDDDDIEESAQTSETPANWINPQYEDMPRSQRIQIWMHHRHLVTVGKQGLTPTLINALLNLCKQHNYVKVRVSFYKLNPMQIALQFLNKEDDKKSEELEKLVDIFEVRSYGGIVFRRKNLIPEKPVSLGNYKQSFPKNFTSRADPPDITDSSERTTTRFEEKRRSSPSRRDDSNYSKFNPRSASSAPSFSKGLGRSSDRGGSYSSSSSGSSFSRGTRGPSADRGRSSFSASRRPSTGMTSRGSSREYSRSSDSPRQYSRGSDSPRQYSRGSDSPRQYSRGSDSPRQYSRGSDSPRQYSRGSDSPRQYSRGSDSPRQYSRGSDSPRQYSRGSDSPRQYSRGSDSPRQYSRGSDSPRQYSRGSDSRNSFSSDRSPRGSAANSGRRPQNRNFSDKRRRSV
jgi:RNA-binding protein YhbY